jgi:opacity protein-like surface antigen
MRSRVAAVVLLALLLAVPVMAQTKPFILGVKGGVNLANLAFDPEPDPKPDMFMGLGFGGSLGFTISPGMTLDTDFLYLQKGAKWEGSGEDEMAIPDQTYKYTYLVVNPMLRFVVQNQGLRPYFMAGAEVGFLLDAEIETDDGGEEAEEDSYDLKDYTKATDFGVNFGAGLEFPSGNSAFFVEARYSLGLTDIVDEGDAEATKQEDEDDSSSAKHRGIYLMAGMRF